MYQRSKQEIDEIIMTCIADSEDESEDDFYFRAAADILCWSVPSVRSRFYQIMKEMDIGR